MYSQAYGSHEIITFLQWRSLLSRSLFQDYLEFEKLLFSKIYLNWILTINRQMQKIRLFFAGYIIYSICHTWHILMQTLVQPDRMRRNYFFLNNQTSMRRLNQHNTLNQYRNGQLTDLMKEITKTSLTSYYITWENIKYIFNNYFNIINSYLIHTFHTNIIVYQSQPTCLVALNYLKNYVWAQRLRFLLKGAFKIQGGMVKMPHLAQSQSSQSETGRNLRAWIHCSWKLQSSKWALHSAYKSMCTPQKKQNKFSA